VGEPTSHLTGFGHVGVAASDLDRSLAFYVDGLGLTCVSRRVVDEEYIRAIVQVPGTRNIEVAMLALASGQVAVELLRYNGSDSRPEERSVAAAPSEPGTGHLCLFVDDIERAWGRALGMGGTARSPGPVAIQSGIYAGGFGCYLKDPDGYHIELVQPPAAQLT
jgi:lactoylglutathione lyase